MPKLTLAACLALALLSPSALAQFGEKVEVHYVEVPVTVLRDNAPVRGLTKANFEIFDSGQKREIESFDAIDFTATASEVSAKVSPLSPASRRNFLLLFDLSFSSPISLGRAQEAARNFVARSVGNRDLVGVAVLDVDRGFRFLTSFTTDRTLLTAAIRDPRNFRAMDPLQIAGHTAGNLVDTSLQGELAARNDARNDEAAQIMLDLKKSVQASDDAFRRARVEKQVEMLATVARSLQKLAGRKHLVLMSEGFDPRLVQGRMATETLEQQEENAAVSSGELWKVDSDKRFGHAGAQRSIQLMAEEFKRADVVLHAVDIQGVRVQNDTRSGAKVNSNDGLFLLAGSTGGDVFRNTNNLDKDFDNLLKQQEVVYVLGFRAPAGKAGQFHQLKVKLSNVPGGRVVHRGGYYGSGAETTVERALTTAEIVLNDLPQNDLDVAALATAFPMPTGDDSQVPVIIEISGPDLIAAARNNAATTDIFVYAFDDAGLVRDSIYQRIQLDTAQAGEKLKRAGVKFYGTLHLPPGKYAVKSLVRVAESEKKSFRRMNLEVPETGDVAMMQPLFFAEAGDWVMVKTDSRQKAAAYPFVMNGETFIPAARATLRKGEPRLFTVWVWNAQPDELTWEIAPEAKLVSRSEGTVTKLLFALEQVPPGAQELDVTIRKKGSTDERRMSVPIRVQ